MLNDVFPEFDGEAYRSGKAFRLTLYSPDANARWAKALAAGCKISMPIRDQFWGDRYGEVEDPFGFVWAIATHLKDLTSDEIEERRKKMFAGSPPGQNWSLRRKRAIHVALLASGYACRLDSCFCRCDQTCERR